MCGEVVEVGLEARGHFSCGQRVCLMAWKRAGVATHMVSLECGRGAWRGALARCRSAIFNISIHHLQVLAVVPPGQGWGGASLPEEVTVPMQRLAEWFGVGFRLSSR